MKFLALLWIVLPLAAQTRSAVSLADGMLREFDSAVWNAPYRGGELCRQNNEGLASPAPIAPMEWLWHCNRTSAEIATESYYYVFGSKPALMRLDIGLSESAQGSSAAVRQLIESRLTQRFGRPAPEAPLYPISPAGGVRALQWHTAAGGLLLFDGAFNLSPLRPRAGVRLIAVAQALSNAIRDDAKMRNLFDSGLDQPAQDRLARELGPLYGGPAPTLESLLRLLRAARSADGNRKAGMLLRADEMAFGLSGDLGDGKHQAAAEAARRQLTPFGVRLGPQRKDGLEYNRDLLSEVWQKYPNTEWGQYAFLLLQQFGWNPSFDGYVCPKNPDYFRDVIRHGEAFLASYPQSPVRLQVLLGVATAYETWWSLSFVPANDENFGHYPRRAENDRQKNAARLNAIARYQQIRRIAPTSPYALFAARHLPWLRLSLNTGFRPWFCAGD